MSKIIGYLKKTGLFAIRYFICPFVIVFGISFFALTCISFLVNPIDIFSLVQTSASLGILASIAVFIVQALTQFVMAVERIDAKKLQSFEERFPKLPSISIKTRIELKKSYFSLSVSMFLFSFATFLKANYPITQQNPLGTFVSFVFLMVAYVFFQAYIDAYEQNEKAVYYLETSVKNIEYCLEKDLKPYIRFLENGLKAHQNTMAPSHSFRNLKSRIKQAELIFERGTKEEIGKVRDFIGALANAIKENNTPAFDETFSKLILFLDQFEDKKKDIIQFDVPSRREIARKSLFEFVEIGIKKAMPYLIIVAFIALLYILFGIPINVPFGG